MLEELNKELDSAGFTMGLIDDDGDKVKMVNVKVVKDILKKAGIGKPETIIREFNELSVTELNDSDLAFLHSAANNQHLYADTEIWKREKK